MTAVQVIVVSETCCVAVTVHVCAKNP